MADPTLSDFPTATLIDLYFDSEAPEERDALFETLAVRDDAQAKDFFAAVLAHDADPFLRVQAAATLAAQGDATARAWLTDMLRAPAEDGLFEEALLALEAASAPDLFELLEAVAQDPNRDVDDRRLALAALPRLDPARGLARLRALLQAPEAPWTLPLDLMAQALMALVVAASGPESAEALQDRALVEALRRAVAKAPYADPADAHGYLDLCDEALAVLSAPEPEGA